MQLVEAININTFLRISRHLSGRRPLAVYGPALRQRNKSINNKSIPSLVDDIRIIRTILCDSLECLPPFFHRLKTSYRLIREASSLRCNKHLLLYAIVFALLLDSIRKIPVAIFEKKSIKIKRTAPILMACPVLPRWCERGSSWQSKSSGRRLPSLPSFDSLSLW